MREGIAETERRQNHRASSGGRRPKWKACMAKCQCAWPLEVSHGEIAGVIETLKRSIIALARADCRCAMSSEARCFQKCIVLFSRTHEAGEATLSGAASPRACGRNRVHIIDGTGRFLISENKSPSDGIWGRAKGCWRAAISRKNACVIANALPALARENPFRNKNLARSWLMPGGSISA